MALGRVGTLENTPKVYRPDIDGLRAFAVIAVVLFHAFPQTIPGGFIGVDVFFVISGFLISGHIYADVVKGRFNVFAFYGRRVMRIYPALLLVILCCLCLGWRVLFSTELRSLFRDAAAASVFISNIVFWRTANYFAPSAESQPLLHLWSLGVEEQFYIFWPLWLVLMGRRWRLVMAGTIVLMLASFVANVLFVQNHPSAVFYIPFTRVWELWAGALLGIYVQGRRDPSSGAGWPSAVAVSNIASWLAFFVFGIALVLLSPQSVFPGWWGMLPVLASVLVIFAGPEAFLNRWVLRSRLLIYIGLISYPLYLWHWPVLTFIRILNGGQSPIGWMITAVLLSVLLAAGTYKFLETPLKQASKGYKSRFRFTALLLFMMAIVGMVSAGFWLRGVPKERFANADIILAGEQHFENSPQCVAVHGTSADFCRTLSAEPNQVLLLGDSHANHLFDGLARPVQAEGMNLVAIGSGNCQPFYNVETHLRSVRKGCPGVFNQALDFAFDTSAVKSVILSSYAIAAVSGGLDYSTGDGIYLSESEKTSIVGNSEAIYLGGLRRTLEASLRSNKPVILVLDTPELNFDPIACIVRPLELANKDGCSVKRELVDQRQAYLKMKVESVASTFANVVVFDPADYLCDSKRCEAERNGSILFIDRDHLSTAGSDLIGRALAETIRRSISSGSKH